MAHMRKQIKDPELRRKLTPDYSIGCKRILPTNEWYPALAQPNVEVVTGGLTEVRPHSVVAEDGTEREVDTIIFGTGFHVTDVPIADRVEGGDGRTLTETWNGSMQAYKGTTVAGYPNLFFLVGPNTGLGHTSIVFIIESQIAYVLDALHDAPPRRATLEVREEAQSAYNAELDRMTEGTVWVTGGCTSYYIDRNGHNSALWPTYTWPFRQRTRRVRRGAYALGVRERMPAPAAALPSPRRAQHVLEPRRASSSSVSTVPGQYGLSRPVRDEGPLVEPAAGVPEPGAGQGGPLGLLVAGQRAGAVGVPEDHVLGARRQHLRHARHGEQAGAAQLLAGERGAEGAEPQPVERGHRTGDGDPAEQEAAASAEWAAVAAPARQTSRERSRPRDSDAGEAPWARPA